MNRAKNKTKLSIKRNIANNCLPPTIAFFVSVTLMAILIVCQTTASAFAAGVLFSASIITFCASIDAWLNVILSTRNSDTNSDSDANDDSDDQGLHE